ncbi:uncharacterized protein ARMOST_15087 [Armillaria ostoyae]|uniref:Uncharacterized protein n=1 Tax=Armillaria ostoyae TaxID=47428 RepID=A0A284RSE1_ARMOS|nr:uncharacterized protein ARMOST_15087 [Armillaria ostoyae]
MFPSQKPWTIQKAPRCHPENPCSTLYWWFPSRRNMRRQFLIDVRSRYINAVGMTVSLLQCHVSIKVVDGLYYGYTLSTALSHPFSLSDSRYDRFFGITIVQTRNYLNTNADGWLMRSLVAFLVAMDAGVNTQILHHYLPSFGLNDL